MINTKNRDEQMKKRIIKIVATVYCLLFVAGSAFWLIGRLYKSTDSWTLAGYVLALLLFCYLLLLLQSEGQFRRQKKELINELNQTKASMQQVQLQKRQEQLNALQSQINPHFLYNTLDTIRGLAIEKKSMDIANVVGALASMFKYSVDYVSTNVTLSDEMFHLEQYLSIQSMRFPGKFQVEKIYDCEPESLFQISVPKMTLQPIVENAISHGLKNRSDGGKITIRFISSDTGFLVVVRDNGTGIPEDMVLALNRSFRNSDAESELPIGFQFGIALSNINSRIKIYCGPAYGLFVASTVGIGTDVTVRLPASKKES